MTGRGRYHCRRPGLGDKDPQVCSRLGMLFQQIDQPSLPRSSHAGPGAVEACGGSSGQLVAGLLQPAFHHLDLVWITAAQHLGYPLL